MNAQNQSQIVAVPQGIQLATKNTAEMTPYANEQYSQYTSGNYNSESIDVGDYFRTLLNHKLLISASILMTSILALLYTLSITPTYKASTTLQIDQTTNKVVNYNVLEGQSQQGIDKHFYQTQYDILKSRKLAARVINQLNLSKYDKNDFKKPIVAQGIENTKVYIKSLIARVKTPDEGEATVIGEEGDEAEAIDPDSQLAPRPIELDFLNSLTITPSEKSNIVEVAYETYDPKMAAKIANSLAENYIGMSLEGKGNSSEYAKKFISEQLAISKKNLEGSEQELVDYAKEHRIINTDDNNSIISSELQTLSTAYIDAKKELIFAESSYRKKHKISGAIRLMDNGVIQSLKQRKGSLEAKYAEMLIVYKPSYPAMVQLKKEISALQSQVNTETSLISQASSENLQANFLAAQQNSRALKGQLSAKKKEILQLRDKNIGYKVLERETTTNREIYNGLLQRMREIDVASGAIDNNIFVIDTAFVPYKKYKPNMIRNVLAGGILGLFFGIIFAFFKENNNDTVKDQKEIEALTNLPVIGRFPLTKGKKSPLILHEKHDLTVEEAFHSIAVDLGFTTDEGVPKILHITSAEPGEGKSSTAINIATTMANEGARVILIDADLRRSTLHKYFDIKNEAGLSDILSGNSNLSNALQSLDNIPNLSILTAGTSNVNPVKLLDSNNLLKLMILLTKHFDQIIIDSPPVLGMADALILANRSHATLFLTANKKSKKASITDSLRRLSRSYTNVIGLILTKDPMKIEGYYTYKP